MKQKHLLKSFFLLLALMVGSSAWAVTITFADLRLENGVQYTDPFDGGDFTVTFAGGANDGKYYTTGTGIRVYGGGTMTIAAKQGNITAITITYDGSNKPTSDDVVNVGTYNSNNGTWTGNAASVVFTRPSGSGHWRVQTIEATVSSATNVTATPTFSPSAGTYTSAQSVEISCATDGATIHYTTDGTEPNAESTTYAQAITVSETMTIKAIAVAAGYDNSSVATAAYKIVTLQHAGTEADPYSVADARAAIDANTGVTNVYVKGIVCTGGSNLNSGAMNYWISDDGTETNKFEIYKGKGIDGASFESTDDVQKDDEVVVYGNLKKYNSTYEFDSGSQLVSLKRVEKPTITADDVELAYDATSGEIAYTIENPVDGQSLKATTTAEWISGITVSADKVTFTTTTNEDQADRTATITLSYEGADNKVVTVTQGHYVADFATLPFKFVGGRADIENTAGLTQSDLGTDYNSSPYLKFDGTGDYVILKIDEAPGKLTFDIKGNPGSNGWSGTFTVQTSADGVTYSDLATYTELGTTQSEEFNTLGEDVRYIKWIYTEKVSGNVALGNIKLEKPSTEPVITVDPDEIEVDAGEHDGTLAISYENLSITDMKDFDIQYYDAEGEETSEPDWIEVLVAEQDPEVGEGYVVSYYMAENEGEARTAYFKVYALDEDANAVYSGLVTITQAAYVAPAEPGNWVLTDLTNLTENDVFVIVGDNGDTYAMTNDNGTNAAPAAVEVTVVEGTLSGKIAANLQWTLTSGEDGYIFYPNGDNESWLYCTNTNNGVRVGTNTNNLFTVENGYLKNEATGRYVGIYDSQDWRCYTTCTGNSNIADQTFSFYKKVSAKEESISVSGAGYRTYCSENALDFSAVEGLTAYKATITDNKVSFIEVEQVPAGQGVLLKGAADTYEVPVIASAAELEDNKFIGVTEETTIDTDPANGIFVLMNPEGGQGVGFYKTTGSTFTLGAHTAYLPALGANARSFIGFDFDNTTTAIEGVATVENRDGEVYNLQGQRVVKAQKGLYIVNGKKMVIK